jgi:hypothetical protein
MTRDQATQAMKNHAKIIGYAGEDTDTGRIIDLSFESTGRVMATVAWDSLQQSECDIEGIELVEDP